MTITAEWPVKSTSVGGRGVADPAHVDYSARAQNRPPGGGAAHARVADFPESSVTGGTRGAAAAGWAPLLGPRAAVQPGAPSGGRLRP